MFSIGAGSVIGPGVVIGKNSFIGSGSNVLKSVDSDKLVYGNPAKSFHLPKKLEGKI